DRDFSEPTGRLELPTGGLRNRCSTTELRRRVFLSDFATFRTGKRGLRKRRADARSRAWSQVDTARRVRPQRRGAEQGRCQLTSMISVSPPAPRSSLLSFVVWWLM